ncbi:hypothetical protein D3C74_91310 [compost metagenome]
MDKFRIGYVYHFNAHKPVYHEGQLIGGMSVGILFKVLNLEGIEVFFESNEEKEFFLELEGERYSLGNSINCSFDKKKIIKIQPRDNLLIKFKDIKVNWEIYDFTKDVGEGMLIPHEVTEDIFKEIMEKNIDAFDNSDNESAQSLAYFTQKV